MYDELEIWFLKKNRLVNYFDYNKCLVLSVWANNYSHDFRSATLVDFVFFLLSSLFWLVAFLTRFSRIWSSPFTNTPFILFVLLKLRLYPWLSMLAGTDGRRFTLFKLPHFVFESVSVSKLLLSKIFLNCSSALSSFDLGVFARPLVNMKLPCVVLLNDVVLVALYPLPMVFSAGVDVWCDRVERLNFSPCF